MGEEETQFDTDGSGSAYWYNEQPFMDRFRKSYPPRSAEQSIIKLSY